MWLIRQLLLAGVLRALVCLPVCLLVIMRLWDANTDHIANTLQPNLNIIRNTNCDKGTCYSILNGGAEVFRTSSAQTGIICKFLLSDKMNETASPRCRQIRLEDELLAMREEESQTFLLPQSEFLMTLNTSCPRPSCLTRSKLTTKSVVLHKIMRAINILFT